MPVPAPRWPQSPGAGSGLTPSRRERVPTWPPRCRRLAAAGAERIVLAPYLLAPGVLPDRAVETARSTARELGVELVVAEPLGAADEVVDLIARRARGAAS